MAPQYAHAPPPSFTAPANYIAGQLAKDLQFTWSSAARTTTMPPAAGATGSSNEQFFTTWTTTWSLGSPAGTTAGLDGVIQHCGSTCRTVMAAYQKCETEPASFECTNICSGRGGSETCRRCLRANAVTGDYWQIDDMFADLGSACSRDGTAGNTSDGGSGNGNGKDSGKDNGNTTLSTTTPGPVTTETTWVMATLESTPSPSDTLTATDATSTDTFAPTRAATTTSTRKATSTKATTTKGATETASSRARPRAVPLLGLVVTAASLVLAL